MEGLAAVVVVSTIASVIYLVRWSTATARGVSLKKAAEAAGLTDITVSQKLGMATGVLGTAGLHPVSLECYSPSQWGHGSTIQVCIDGLQYGPFELALRWEDLGTTFSKVIGEPDIEIGDAAFDERVYVSGLPTVAYAVLDADARHQILRLLQGQVHPSSSGASLNFNGRAWLSDGRLYAEISAAQLGAAYETLAGILRGLLVVAQKLVRPADLGARLAENARRDPLAPVRLANLNTLVREYPGRPETVETLHAALEDADDEVRLRAAIALGNEGAAVLLDIASRVGTTEARAAETSAALAGRLPLERGRQILGDALQTRRLRVVEACVKALGEVGGPEAVEVVSRVLAVETGNVAIAAASALGAIGGAAAEHALIKALVRGDADVRVAVAEGLGRAGTIAAVMPLREATARLPGYGPLRRAARQAIGEIQARLAGASAGQLSLALGEDGRVSLVPEGEHGGELSLPDPPTTSDDSSPPSAA